MRVTFILRPSLKRWVVPLDGGHGVIDEFPDGRQRCTGLEALPAPFLQNPEDAGGPLLDGMLGVGAVLLLCLQLSVQGPKSCGGTYIKHRPETQDREPLR